MLIWPPGSNKYNRVSDPNINLSIKIEVLDIIFKVARGQNKFRVLAWGNVNPLFDESF